MLTLEQAIRKMTSWPATRMRLADRGAIREGLWADVVVFDYQALADRATYEQPTLSPAGIDYVVVNGEVVIDHDRHTGARPGRVLHGPGRKAPRPGGAARAETAPQARVEVLPSRSITPSANL